MISNFIIGLSFFLVYFLMLYSISLDALLAEQVARIEFNEICRNLGHEELYSLEELKGDRVD